MKPKKDETVWKKATLWHTTYLPPAGPRRGQSTDAYLYGKDVGHKKAVARYKAIQAAQKDTGKH